MGPILGGIKKCKCMVVLRDFPSIVPCLGVGNMLTRGDVGGVALPLVVEFGAPIWRPNCRFFSFYMCVLVKIISRWWFQAEELTCHDLQTSPQIGGQKLN